MDVFNMKILVTGAAGFIGFHLVLRLLEKRHRVLGLDSINDYYDTELKYSRLAISGIDKESIVYGKKVISKFYDNYKFIKLDLQDRKKLNRIMEKEKFDSVCNLAAQAGVRYSIENPYAYIDSNLTGFINILEGCKSTGVKHLCYASSSSVYGLNKNMPFCIEDKVDQPISLYAATKKANELMAHVYTNLFGLTTTGLRFFTVYGPWGRPDMALFLFTKAIFEDRAIDVFNNGVMMRDFTYIDDIIEGLIRILEEHSNGKGDSYELFNIGAGNPVKLMDFIEALEQKIGKKAIKNFLPLQPGDVPSTWADTSGLEDAYGYKPKIMVYDGVSRFVDWYRSYYKL